MYKYDVLKMKEVCVLDARGGGVKVTYDFDSHNITKKLEKSAKCSEVIEAPKSLHSVKSAAQSGRSQSENSRAGGSHKSQNSVKSGGEAQSQKGSKALSSASMENKSVKQLDLTDLESKRSGKSRVIENGGGKNGGNGGCFGFGKFFGFGKNGGEKGPKRCSKKSHSEKGGETMSAHSAAGNSSVGRSSRAGSKRSSIADDIPFFQDREPSVGRSSRGGSKKGSKRGPMSHHSGEERSQMGDPYIQQDLPMTAMMNQQRGAYYDEPHRSMSPPPRHQESYEHYFSDENPNACNIM